MTKVLIEQTWNGSTLTEIFTVGGEKFKTNVGLQNGGGPKQVSILGNDGWAYFLTLWEIGFKWQSTPEFRYDPSYVSDDDERKDWAEQGANALKRAVEKVYA